LTAPGAAEDTLRAEGGKVATPDCRKIRGLDRPSLVGRAVECGLLADLLAGARDQRSGALVLSGEPGIGKSALCAWAVERAGEMRVLAISGVESESDLPFAALSELCADEWDRIGLLPEPQARALEGALARRAEARADRFALGAAVLSLLAVAGDGDPVLAVIDDAQWLDASSADALLFAARRLRREAVVLLAATRPDTLFDNAQCGLPRLVVERLDQAAARALLSAAHGPLPTHVAEVLAQRSDGNPLALLELPRALSPAQLAGEQAIDEPLPLGPALSLALLNRQSDLPADTRGALLLAAASGSERLQPVLDALAAALMAPDALDAAERAGVLTIAGERFEFRHPLLRSAIYHAAPDPARRDAHALLGRVVSGPQRVWHLAQAAIGEDEDVAALLEQAALEARSRGAPAAAASAMERAARLTGADDRRARRLTEAARDAHVAGRSAGALCLLDDAMACGPTVIQRAEIQHARGRILVLQGHIETAYRLLLDEAEVIRDVDPERTAMMLAEACLHCFLSADVPRALVAARDAVGVAEAASPRVRAFAGVILAVALVLHGERAEAGAMLDRFLPLLRLADPLTEAGELLALAAQCYFWLDRLDIAAELLNELTASARAASAPAALLLPLSCRAELDMRAGRWALAAAQFHEVAHLGEEMTRSVYAAYALECLARLAAAVGDEARCREHAGRATALIDEHHNELGRLYVLSALGLLELGLGRTDAAIQALERARDLAGRHGLREPNVVHWQADLVEAYVHAGQRDRARDALSALDRQAEHTGGRWALGTAARCRGLLAGERGDDAGFAAACDHLEAVQAPFELARTHLCRGECLRRAGRRIEARRALQTALDGFEQLGSGVWATRAHVELRATGATPRRRRDDSERDQLTPHELQVAVMVANGATNREAAGALFLSPKTIEFHLTHIYRKLGARTRTELAAIAASRGWLEARTREIPGANRAGRYEPTA
jgi:DNA-binding CsgD family transcriptional regulator